LWLGAPLRKAHPSAAVNSSAERPAADAGNRGARAKHRLTSNPRNWNGRQSEDRKSSGFEHSGLVPFASDHALQRPARFRTFQVYPKDPRGQPVAG
jgi:hypothetical protein